MADTKISALSAGSALAGTEEIPVVQSAATVKTTPAAIKTYIETGGTVTASDPVLDLSQTWNNGAVAFTGLKFNATDTASAAASLPLDVQIGGTSALKVRVDGRFSLTKQTFQDFEVLNAVNLIFSNNSSLPKITLTPLSIKLQSSSTLSWVNSSNSDTGTTDVSLVRDAANRLALRRATNAQALIISGTYTDGSNFVQAELAATSTSVTLSAVTAGTGADNVPVILAPAGTSQIEVGNGVQFTEMTAPSAPAANKVILFAQDNGAGKTQLMALFASGAAQVLATEP